MISIKALLKLIEVKTLVAGIAPVVFGSVYSLCMFGTCNILYFLILLVAVIFTQSATNLMNDYFDFKRGADKQERKEEKALVSGDVSEKQVFTAIVIFVGGALFLGIILAVQTSFYILFVVGAGALVSFFYSFGKAPLSYLPIGEVVSGTTMGIGIATTVIFIHTGIWNANTVLSAVPTSLFIATILLTNNLCDIESDRIAGRKTLSILIGIKRSETLWVANVISLLLLTLLFTGLQIYPLTVALFVLLLFPYPSVRKFLSFEKKMETKYRAMGIIGQIGLRFHLALVTGLIMDILIRR